MDLSKLSMSDLKKLFFQTKSGGTGTVNELQVLFYKQQLGIV